MDIKIHQVGWGRKVSIIRDEDFHFFVDCGSKSFGKYKSEEEYNVENLILSHWHGDHYNLIKGFSCDAHFFYNANGFTFNQLLGSVNTLKSRKEKLEEFLDILLDSSIKKNLKFKEVWATDSIGEIFKVHYPNKQEKENLSLENNDTNKFVDDYKNELKEYVHKEFGKIESLENEVKLFDILIEIEAILRLYSLNEIDTTKNSEIDTTKKNEINDKFSIAIKKLMKYKIEKENNFRLLKLSILSNDKLKTFLGTAHISNVVLTAKNNDNIIYLPGDITGNLVKDFNPKIIYENIKYFEFPHHGSKKDDHWTTEYNSISKKTIAFRTNIPIYSPSYIPSKFKGVIAPHVSKEMKGSNWIYTTENLDVNNYLFLKL